MRALLFTSLIFLFVGCTRQVEQSQSVSDGTQPEEDVELQGSDDDRGLSYNRVESSIAPLKQMILQEKFSISISGTRSNVPALWSWVDNALEYTPRKGRPAIRISPDFAVVEYRDTTARAYLPSSLEKIWVRSQEPGRNSRRRRNGGKQSKLEPVKVIKKRQVDYPKSIQDGTPQIIEFYLKKVKHVLLVSGFHLFCFMETDGELNLRWARKIIFDFELRCKNDNALGIRELDLLCFGKKYVGPDGRTKPKPNVRPDWREEMKGAHVAIHVVQGHGLFIAIMAKNHICVYRYRESGGTFLCARKVYWDRRALRLFRREVRTELRPLKSVVIKVQKKTSNENQNVMLLSGAERMYIIAREDYFCNVYELVGFDSLQYVGRVYLK